jgi:hypothetical protein
MRCGNLGSRYSIVLRFRLLVFVGDQRSILRLYRCSGLVTSAQVICRVLEDVEIPHRRIFFSRMITHTCNIETIRSWSTLSW